MNKNPYDFAQGKKTITGILLLILPTVVYFTGVDLDPNSIVDIVNGLFALIGTTLTVYGLIMKVIRKFKK